MNINLYWEQVKAKESLKIKAGKICQGWYYQTIELLPSWIRQHCFFIMRSNYDYIIFIIIIIAPIYLENVNFFQAIKDKILHLPQIRSLHKFLFNAHSCFKPSKSMSPEILPSASDLHFTSTTSKLLQAEIQSFLLFGSRCLNHIKPLSMSPK